MGSPTHCQHNCAGATAEKEVPCSKPVHNYRQCGRGKCGKEIAYCDDHGGDERATREMAEHITQEHNTP